MRAQMRVLMRAASRLLALEARRLLCSPPPLPSFPLGINPASAFARLSFFDSAAVDREALALVAVGEASLLATLLATLLEGGGAETLFTSFTVACFSRPGFFFSGAAFVGGAEGGGDGLAGAGGGAFCGGGGVGDLGAGGSCLVGSAL